MVEGESGGNSMRDRFSVFVFVESSWLDILWLLDGFRVFDLNVVGEIQLDSDWVDFVGA